MERIAYHSVTVRKEQGCWLNYPCGQNYFCRETAQLYSPLIVNPWQTKIRIPPMSNLVSQWVLLRLLTGAEMTQRQRNHQGPPQHSDSSQKLGTWSTMHSLQAAQQVGVSFPSDSGPGSWAGLRVFAAFLSESLHCSSASLGLLGSLVPIWESSLHHSFL